MNCEYCTTEDNRNDAGRVFYKELIHDSIIRTTLDDTHLQLAHDKNGWVLHFEDESGDRMFDVPINACPMCGASLTEPRPCATCVNRGWETMDKVAACNCCENPDYEFYAQAKEDEPKPLTLDKLREMNDQLVYVVVPCVFDEMLVIPSLVAYDPEGEDGDEVFLTNNQGGRSSYDDCIAKGMKIFDRKPKEEER